MTGNIGLEVISAPILKKLDEIQKLLNEVYSLLPPQNKWRAQIEKAKLNFEILADRIKEFAASKKNKNGLEILDFNELLEEVLAEIKLLNQKELSLKLGNLLTGDLEKAMNKLNLKLASLEGEIKRFVG